MLDIRLTCRCGFSPAIFKELDYLPGYRKPALKIHFEQFTPNYNAYTSQ